MQDIDYMNGWIKVKENIGTYSAELFGVVGTKIEVVNGEFISNRIDCINNWNSHWNNGTYRFKDVKDINKYFSNYSIIQTVFELVSAWSDEDTEIKELKSCIIKKAKLTLEYIDESSSIGLDKNISEVVLNFCEALSILKSIEKGE